MCVCVCLCVCADLQVQVHQVVLVEVVDSLQGLPDQTGDLGLGQQLLGHAVVKYLSAGRTGQRENTASTPRNTQGEPPEHGTRRLRDLEGRLYAMR